VNVNPGWPNRFVNINSGLRALIAILVVAFLGVVGYSLRDTSAKEGGEAPAFTVKTDSGSQVTATSFGGKVLVLNFWATWCPPCIQEIPSLDRFQKQFAGSGVKVVAISIDKNPQKYKNFLEHVHVSFDTARDPDADVSTRYGTFQIPETYIIKDGRIMRKFAEGENWVSEDIVRYVQSLL
jgi:cytochrome c biogenesis protein CcmG, thiol:disulfide interchange protein DsbE